MKLREGTPYSLNTFGTSTTPGVKISGLRASDDIENAQAVFLDSPFSGRCDGLVSHVQERRLPIDEPSSLLRYVTIIWAYIGNGGEEPLDGTYGSVICDYNGGVVAIFRYADNGWAIATSVDPLIEAGLEVCEIE